MLISITKLTPLALLIILSPITPGLHQATPTLFFVLHEVGEDDLLGLVVLEEALDGQVE